MQVVYKTIEETSRFAALSTLAQHWLNPYDTVIFNTKRDVTLVMRNLYNLFGHFIRQIQLRFSPRDQSTETLNRELQCYPSNHNYRIQHQRLYPSFELHQRYNQFEALLPEKVNNFLDIGCCKGFYVLHMAQRAGCTHAVGIDLNQPFITLANQAKTAMKLTNADFHLSSLGDVANEPARFGGPFHTILLIGTYHYLFWGSRYCPEPRYLSHDKILSMLSRICQHQVILSGRLEIQHLPRNEQATAQQMQIPYNTQGFLTAANQYFDVNQVGHYGKYALYVLKKRN